MTMIILLAAFTSPLAFIVTIVLECISIARKASLKNPLKTLWMKYISQILIVFISFYLFMLYQFPRFPDYDISSLEIYLCILFSAIPIIPMIFFKCLPMGIYMAVARLLFLLSINFFVSYWDL